MGKIKPDRCHATRSIACGSGYVYGRYPMFTLGAATNGKELIVLKKHTTIKYL